MIVGSVATSMKTMRPMRKRATGSISVLVFVNDGFKQVVAKRVGSNYYYEADGKEPGLKSAGQALAKNERAGGNVGQVAQALRATPPASPAALGRTDQEAMIPLAYLPLAMIAAGVVFLFTAVKVLIQQRRTLEVVPFSNGNF